MTSDLMAIHYLTNKIPHESECMAPFPLMTHTNNLFSAKFSSTTFNNFMTALRTLTVYLHILNINRLNNSVCCPNNLLFVFVHVYHRYHSKYIILT